MIDFMLIKILFFMFLSTIQFSAYGYELLSSKTTISPGCEGGVLEHITDSHILSPNDYFTASATALTASTEARVFSATGNAKEMIMLQSSHSFSIQNNTNSSQLIKLNVKLSTHDGKCINNEYSYRLKPRELMSDSTTLYFNKQYVKPGNYKVYAHTTLSGNIYSSASDSNSVTIR
jgi:hypothetical protein